MLRSKACHPSFNGAALAAYTNAPPDKAYRQRNAPFNMHSEMKKALRETQTLRAGCSKAEPKKNSPRRRPPSALVAVW